MAVGRFGLTHLSGLSVYGTRESTGEGIRKIIVSTQSVNIGAVGTSDVTTVDLLVTNVDQNAAVFATPHSQWSTDTSNYVNYNAYAPSDHSVSIAFSNFSNTDITIATVNWQIVAIS